jgi:hypothetical protein
MCLIEGEAVARGSIPTLAFATPTQPKSFGVTGHVGCHLAEHVEIRGLRPRIGLVSPGTEP